MIKAPNIRLNPSPEQDTYFIKAAGTARYAYHWAVAQWRSAEGKKPSARALKKRFNAEKPAWVYEVTKCAAAGAFTDFGAALTHYYAKRAEASTFKQRSQGDFKFKRNNDKFEVRGFWAKIPKLGLVNMAEKWRFRSKILGATVSREADWWYISITLERLDHLTLPKAGECGVDVGLLRLVTRSDGTVFEHLRPLRNLLGQWARWQQRLAKRQLASRHRVTLKAKIACLHKRVRDMRDDLLHKLTTWIAAHYGFVAVEDLHVKGLTQNHCLALSLADAALGRLLDLLQTKVITANGQLINVHRFFPSSKTCANGGYKRDDLTLADRLFVCPTCRFTADRDHNAALNLLQEGLRLASNQASSRHWLGRDVKTPPQTGYNLDKRSRILATSGDVCQPER